MLVTCPFVWSEHEVPYDYARYTRFALEDIFKRNGFRVIHFEKQGNFIQAVTQLKALSFIEIAGSTLLRLSVPGNLLRSLYLFMINGWGTIKNGLFPSRQSLYLTNVFLVEKITGTTI
jgi:hypothetical protein